MNLPNVTTLYEVMEKTWPAAKQTNQGPFTLRFGAGGGKRVSAATANLPVALDDLPPAEAAMRAMDQSPLFMIREGDEALDALLEEVGYQIVDPVNIYAVQATEVATELPPRTVAIAAWEPLRIMEEIWQSGGIGAERIDIMHRATEPKTGFISRWQDKPAGASFVGMHQGIAMVHALEIVEHQRRNGLARWAMRRAAYWTLANAGETLSVMCTVENTAANALYTSLGMRRIGGYHYRIKSV